MRRDLFTALPATDVIVNTVNTVGVMGAGVALKFKLLFPDMYRAYREKCLKGELRIGKPFPYLAEYGGRKIIILNFPTKTHWRHPSRYEYIIAGLHWLRFNLKELEKLLGRKIKRIDMPCLGCGLGGLDKNKVIALIKFFLEDLPVQVNVYIL